MGKGMKWLYLGILAGFFAIPYMLISENNEAKVFEAKCKQLGGEPHRTRDGGFCLRANSIIEVK
jgi:TctA family transporter